MLFKTRIYYSSISVTVADLADLRLEKHFWPEYTLTNAGKDVITVASKIIQAEEMPKADKDLSEFDEIFQAALNAGRFPSHMASQKRFSGIFRAALNPENFPCVCSDCCNPCIRVTT